MTLPHQAETPEQRDARRASEALAALRAMLRPAKRPTTPAYIRHAARFRPMGVR